MARELRSENQQYAGLAIRRTRAWQHGWLDLAAGTLGVLALGLRLLVATGAPLVGDEAYYRLWSQQLDWAYYDHPAGVALLLRLSAAIGGEGLVGLRWLNLALGLACVALVYVLGRRWFGRQAALFSAAIVAVGAPYLLVSGLVYTDTLHLALLLLNLWCFSLWVNDGVPAPPGSRAPLAWGLTLALLFNTKYSAYLYAAGLGAAILLDYHWLLRERRFWLAVALAATGLLPVIGWNAVHGWASFRWQLTHLVSASPGSDALRLLTPFRNLWHALGYLTWPVVLAAFLPELWWWIKNFNRKSRESSPVFSGFTLIRAIRGLFSKKTQQTTTALAATLARRLLRILAAALLLPVIFSPANSPRNWIGGLTLLLLLSGATLPRGRGHAAGAHGRRAAQLAVALTLLYGAGTAAAFWDVNSAPASTAAREVTFEGAGMPTLGALLADYPAPLFALDYQLAGQIAYHTGRPAFSAWGQYRVWGLPAFEEATVISLGYLPEACVTPQLVATFDTVSGPDRLTLDETAGKTLHVWRVAGPGMSRDQLAARLDFLTLWEQCR